MVNVFSPALAPPTQISTRWVPGGQAEVSLARKFTTVAAGGTTSWSSPPPVPLGPYHESLTSVPGEIALTFRETKSGPPWANEVPGAPTLPSGDRLWPSTTELMRTARAASAAPAPGAPEVGGAAAGVGLGVGSPRAQLPAQPARLTSVSRPSAVIAILAFMVELLSPILSFALSSWGRARSVPGSRWEPFRGEPGCPGPPGRSARA